MRLPKNTQINSNKLTQYLLVSRKRNDKSLWLAKAGYTIENWQALEEDLRKLILLNDASLIEETKFGQKLILSGKLLGPNGKSLFVTTVWMTEIENKITKFITMYPEKRRR